MSMRHVTITARVACDLPDNVKLTGIAAEALETLCQGIWAHARDLRSAANGPRFADEIAEGEFHASRAGGLAYRTNGGQMVQVSWQAGYGKIEPVWDDEPGV